MAQNENYSQVDLRIGTEAQFNAKVDTLPAGTLFGITDATVSKADLSTDLKNEINGKINKPANPTSDSAVVINSSGTISTKPLSDIAGKSEVYVGTPDPTGGEILWIDPNGTSGSGGSGGGGTLYQHRIGMSGNGFSLTFNIYCSKNTKLTESELSDFQPSIASLEGESGFGAVTMDITHVPEANVFNIAISGVINSGGTATGYSNTLEKPTYTDNILQL